jgi:phosphate-selective porin OprO/OprP
MNRRTLLAIAGAILLGAGIIRRASAGDVNASPADVQQRLEALELKTKVLERRWEVDQENAAAKSKESSTPSIGKDGYSLKSADGRFQIKFQGDIQADGRFYLNDKAEAFTDTFLLRRVRPTVEVTAYGIFDGRIQPNFGGGAAGVDDAYAELRFFPFAKLRAGRFKAPVGLENLQSSSKITFVERGLPAGLLPAYDQGVQLHGDLWGGAATYALAVQNGALDGTNTDSTDNNDRKDFAARVFLTPFKASASDLLNDLGFGVGAAVGKDRGTTNASTTRLPSYKTEGQNAFFTYKTNIIAWGERRRVSPQLKWYPGPVGLLAEYVLSSQEVKSTTTVSAANLRNRAWQVAVTYVLTGERASYNGVKPRKPFDPKQNTWGALELAVRYSQLDVDRNAFPRFADPAKSSRAARAWTGGLNWYLNPVVKTSVDYAYTWFDRGATTGDRVAERAVFSRIQFSF